MPENPQINPFEEYYKLTERQAMLNVELAGGSLVDGMRQTYALVHQRVSDRLQELEAQPEHLLDGAFQAVDTSSTAIGQLEAIEDLLTPEEFAGQYGAYKSRIQKAVDFIFKKAELSDPRLELVTETANKVGAIIVRDVVIGLERVPLTEPEKAELHADTAPAEADLSQLSPIARVATYARALPVNSRQDLKPSQLWAVASDGGEFGPNDWARLKRLFTRLRREGIPVEHNGKRGSGSAYVLSAFRGELASKQRAAQVDAVFPLAEAANIASFFTLFDDVLASKGIEPINRDVAGYCIDALPEGGEPLSNEEVQKMRAGIAAKIVQLA
ncbi:MAG TPA: hypothetical protein VFT87_05800, partial [Candidatus Saccharimonadales bacterium]|nr:hypothetical protein [Candidatus Saccharimonadales bacterium]